MEVLEQFQAHDDIRIAYPTYNVDVSSDSPRPPDPGDGPPAGDASDRERP